MQQNDTMIRVRGVKKQYRLGQIGGGTLTADVQSWWARVRGKEDPNIMIGTDQRLIGKTFMALNGIDLTVYKGEALGIIGGNPKSGYESDIIRGIRHVIDNDSLGVKVVNMSFGFDPGLIISPTLFNRRR